MKAIKNYLFEIVSAIIAFFLLILLVVPYWFGYQMQSSYERLIESASVNSEQSFEVISFDRGWFSTRADLLVKSKANRPLFYFRHQIIHGPVYLGHLLEGKSPFVNMVINGYLVSAPDSEHLLVQLLDNKNKPVTINAAVRMNDDALIDFVIPDVNKTVPAGQFKVSGSTLMFEYFSGSQRFLGELKIEEFLVQGDAVVELTQLFLNFDQVIDRDSISGDLVVSLDSLKLKLMDRLTSFRQLSSRVKNRKLNQLMDLDIDINAAKINAFNEQLNSLSLGVKLSSIYYDLFQEQLVNTIFSTESVVPVEWRVFDRLEIKPFSFFSEHGAFSSEVQLKKLSLGNGQLADFYHLYDTQLNIEVSDILLKRMYEIIVTTFNLNTNDASLFINKMHQVNYLERSNNKFLLRLQNKDGKYLINDLLIPYQDFEENFSNALNTK